MTRAAMPGTKGSGLLVALVVFDARRSCHVRLARETASRTDMRLVTIETIRRAEHPPTRRHRATSELVNREVTQGAALEQLTSAYRVRFDESTPAGTVRASALVRYAQDAAWVHSEALGYDRTWYAERGLTWLVRSLELCILEPAITGATLEVTTRVTGYRKVWARRLATIADHTGDLVACVSMKRHL